MKDDKEHFNHALANSKVMREKMLFKYRINLQKIVIFTLKKHQNN